MPIIPSLPGSVNNNPGLPRELFLKVFGGEVLTEFLIATVMLSSIRTRSISSGKSAQFPAHGRAQPKFLQRGVSIFYDSIEDGSPRTNFNHVERIIHIDDLLVAATMVPDIDDLLNHYDVSSGYSKELGQGLAVKYDRYAFQAVTRAARTNSINSPDMIPSDLGVLGGGGYVQMATATPVNLEDALKAAAQLLDERSVPRERRCAPLPPSLYWLLINSATQSLFDRQLGNTSGVYQKGDIFMCAGFDLKMTNNLPDSNVVSNDPGAVNDYTGDFTDLWTTVFHEDAIGTVLRLAPTFESEHSIDYQSDLLVAKMAAGTGVLRPNCAVEIGAGATQPALDGGE
jgi:hypothetical protein